MAHFAVGAVRGSLGGADVVGHDFAMSCMLCSGSHELRLLRMNTVVGFPENVVEIMVS